MLWRMIRPLVTEDMKRKVCILGGKEEVTGNQARSETRAWGEPKSQNGIFFFAAASWGANLEKVDKIYTRGEKFSKKGHFD